MKSSSVTKLSKKRAKATRSRLWHAVQHGCERAERKDASTNMKEAGAVSEELLPISSVEVAMEKMQQRFDQKYEEGTRALSREMASALETKISALQDQVDRLKEELEGKELTIKMLRQDLNRAQSDIVDGSEVRNWTASDDSDGMLEEDGLCAGMLAQVAGLKSMPELNGRHGLLVKLSGVDGDRWQVDLGSELGIKLVKPCNLRYLARQGDTATSITSPVDIHFHRNDLHLPCDGDGTVQWERALPQEELAAFLDIRSGGGFNCCICSMDVSLLRGCSGYVQCARTDDGETFEEKHILNLLADPPSSVKCLRCHCRATPCKFFERGWCSRGSSCAYLHSDL